MAVNRNRTELVAFYVSAEEKARMREMANRADMSLSDYARKVLLGKIKIKNECEADRNG